MEPAGIVAAADGGPFSAVDSVFFAHSIAPMTCVRLSLIVLIALGALAMTDPATAQSQNERDPVYWDVHDPDRPTPPVVDPGPAPSKPAPVPEDAVVLFDGTDLSAWEQPDGSSAGWSVQDGAMVVEPESGSIQTKEGFGSVQLHVEWMTPADVEGEGQDRGNSGVFLMNTYEVQVLDSYQNETYADGQAAAIYGQYPPLTNAMRPPGEWQTYDIVFHRPHFDEDGTLVRPARMTVYHNGVLVQDHVTLTGPTAYQDRPPYDAHATALPIGLQDHGAPVRFRNIWLRELD